MLWGAGPTRGTGGSIGDWMYLAVPLAVYACAVLALFGTGRTPWQGNPFTFFFRQISDSLERITGFAGWAMAGVLTGLMSLLIAVVGLYWDVAWHIDLGRDDALFTPSHVMILVGLGGLVFAGAIATLFATLDRAEAGLSVAGLRIPWSALTAAAMGLGAVAAFPIDELWHRTYGIDVTLWSPSHLQLVAGGSLTTIAFLLMMAEAMPASRPRALGKAVFVLTSGTVLTGVSTFQGEFDFGVPQFQVLYLPVLIAAAGGFALVLGRIAIGPGGAIATALVFVLLRGLLALVVAGSLGHTMPRFPLYLFAAAAVEVGAWLGRGDRLRTALYAGALAGTVGLAGELAWVQLSGWGVPAPGLFAEVATLGPIAALSGAVLAAGLGVAFGAGGRVPALALIAAGVGLALALAFPLPRRVGDVTAVIRLDRVSGPALARVDLRPRDAARSATAFAVTSWQGGGRISALLEEKAPGRYVASRRIPIGGRWKSSVTLQRSDEVMAAPIRLPADPEIGASAIPAVPRRTERFEHVTKVLMREAHGGPAWPAIVAFTGLGLLIAMWSALLAATARRAARPVASPRGPEPVPVAAQPVAGAPWGART